MLAVAFFEDCQMHRVIKRNPGVQVVDHQTHGWRTDLRMIKILVVVKCRRENRNLQTAETTLKATIKQLVIL